MTALSNVEVIRGGYAAGSFDWLDIIFRMGNREATCSRLGLGHATNMKVEIEQESDGRWIAEVPSLPGAMAYGSTRAQAVAKAEALVLRIMADKLEHGEAVPQISEVFSVPA
jgi:predicted RNase H-like HicB family nuclease